MPISLEYMSLASGTSYPDIIFRTRLPGFRLGKPSHGASLLNICGGKHADPGTTSRDPHGSKKHSHRQCLTLVQDADVWSGAAVPFLEADDLRTF